MKLSRSDTYINVYIPREDGGDPRRLLPLNYPVFDRAKIYKFSEEVKKDRKLFLGKKQLSLYEMYYKSNRGLRDDTQDNENKENETTKEETENSSSEEEDEVEHHYHHGDNLNMSAPVKKVSLSLDSKLRKSKTPRRFNETLNKYVTNKTKNMTSRLDAAQNIERQVSSVDLLKLDRQSTVYDNQSRQNTFYDNIERQRTLVDIRERQPTFHDSRDRQQLYSETRQKTFYDSPYRLSAFPASNKSFSSTEASVGRSMGLPPINLGYHTTRSPVPYSNFHASASKSAPKRIPLRPSSRPQKIWRQTTDIFMDRRTPRISNTSMAIHPHQQLAYTLLGQYPAY